MTQMEGWSCSLGRETTSDVSVKGSIHSGGGSEVEENTHLRSVVL